MEVLCLLLLIGFVYLLLERRFWLFPGTMIAIGFGTGGIVILLGGAVGPRLGLLAVASLSWNFVRLLMVMAKGAATVDRGHDSAVLPCLVT